MYRTKYIKGTNKPINILKGRQLIHGHQTLDGEVCVYDKKQQQKKIITKQTQENFGIVVDFCLGMGNSQFIDFPFHYACILTVNQNW